MGSSRFPESGMKAVLEVADFLRDADRYVKAIDQLNRADDKAVVSGSRLQRGLGALGRSFQSAGNGLRTTTRRFQEVERSSTQAGLGISRFTSRVLTIQGVLSITRQMVNAFQSVNNAIGDLGRRAAEIQSVSAGFESVTRAIGGAENVMGQLRDQSQGMVSDLDLMRVANVALINSSEEFASIVGENFGTVVQAAFAGAAATGQDLQIVLEKVTRGLRRQSNLLLDDIGIWVTADEANARYAASIGTTVAALTEEQTQAAFAAEAIRQMSDVINASGFSFDSMAAQSAMASAQMANDMNQLAVNAQAGATGFQMGFAQIGATITGALATLDPTPFFEGGANIIASLAEGILSGLTFVIQAITAVAQTIASFLSGLSPPPVGPLSDIDKGGARVIEAWLSEFNKVSLDPVSQLSQNVANILAGTGALTTEQQIGVLEATQTRLQQRLSGAVAGLGRGEARGAEVQALDQETTAIAEQLKLLKERQDLERLFGDSAVETQTRIAQAASTVVGGDGGIGGADGIEKATAAEKEHADAVSATGQAVKETAKEVDKLAETAGGGGGAGRAATPATGGSGLPGIVTAATGMAGGDMAVDALAGPGAGGAATRIERTLARVTEAIEAFGGVVQTAVTNFENIDLFGAVADFFERLEDITTPQELVDFIVNLAAGLTTLPLEIVTGLSDALASITGIELPDWLEHGLAVGLGMVAISQGLSLITGAARLLMGAISPLSLAILGLTVFFALLDSRFGSVEEGFARIGRELEDLFLDIEQGAVRLEIAIGKALGLDVSGAEQREDEIFLRQQLIDLVNRAAEEAQEIIAGERISFSPFIELAFENEQLDPESTPIFATAVNTAVAAALASGDAIELAAAIRMANVTGVDIDPLAQETFQTEVNTQLSSADNPMDVQVEILAAILSGDVSVDDNTLSQVQIGFWDALRGNNEFVTVEMAQMMLSIAGAENITYTDEARTHMDTALGRETTAVAADGVHIQRFPISRLGEVELTPEAREELIVGIQSQVTDILSGGVEVEGVVLGQGVLNFGHTRSGGVPGGGGFGAGSLMSGREGAVPSNIMDVVAGRFGGGGEMSGMITDIEAVTTALDASMLSWQNYQATVTTTMTAIVTSVGDLVIQIDTMTASELALTEATINLDAAYTGYQATLLNSLPILMRYTDQAQLATEQTHEFAQAIAALPSHVSVILDVEVRVTNLTELGSRVAAGMRGSDEASIDGMASGGPFGPGQMFMVGENGPELIQTGNTSGRVIPIQAPPLNMSVLPAPVVMGGGNNVTQNINGPTDAGANMRRMRELAALGVFG